MVGFNVGLEVALRSVRESLTEPSELSEISVIKVTSRYAKWCLFKQKTSLTDMNAICAEAQSKVPDKLNADVLQAKRSKAWLQTMALRGDSEWPVTAQVCVL